MKWIQTSMLLLVFGGWSVAQAQESNSLPPWDLLEQVATEVVQKGAFELEISDTHQKVIEWIHRRGYHHIDTLRKAFHEGQIKRHQIRQILETLSLEVSAKINPLQEETLEQIHQLAALSLQFGWHYHYAYFGNLRMMSLHAAQRNEEILRLYQNQRDLLEGLYKQNATSENALALLYTLSIYLYLDMAGPGEIKMYRREMERLLAQVDQFPLWPDFKITYYLSQYRMEMKAENYGRARAMLDTALMLSQKDYLLARFEASYYFQRGDYSRVETILDSALARYGSDSADDLLYLYHLAYLNAEAQQKWAEALKYFKLYSRQMSFQNQNGALQGQCDKAMLYELDAAQEALKRAMQEKEQRKFWMIWLSAIFGLIILVLLAIHGWRMNKLKIKKVEEQKVNIMESNNLKYVSDIKLIESKWNEVYQAGRNTELPKELEDKLKHMNSTLKGIINDISLLGNQGRDFSTTEFISRLRNLHSRVTDQEARIAIAARVSSNDQEASEKLGMSLAAYRKAKSRLKKKLFPESGERIADLLQRL